MGNILSAQDAVVTVLIYKAKSLQWQINRKVNMSKVNEANGIREGPEHNYIKLPELLEKELLGNILPWMFHTVHPVADSPNNLRLRSQCKNIYLPLVYII